MIRITKEELFNYFVAPINWRRVIEARFAETHCAYCDETLTRRNRSRDHIVPRYLLKSLPLKNRMSLNHLNVVPCCKNCNHTKNHHTLQEWAFLPNTPVKVKEFLIMDKILDFQILLN